ncbi:MAG: hypothetical protein ABJE66_19850 [Deltaproteobacteria bacterium]
MNKLAILVALTACGGDNSTAIDASSQQHDAKLADSHAAGGNVVTGTLGGNSFGALDAVANAVTANGFDFDMMSTMVEMTTFANECSLQMTSTGTPNGHLLIFDLASTDSAGHSAPISAPGTYTVFSGSAAASSKLSEVYYEVDGANCLKASTEFATSGTVTVTSATAPLAGTFDVTFPDGHITGSFSAANCAALDPNRTPLNGC